MKPESLPSSRMSGASPANAFTGDLREPRVKANQLSLQKLADNSQLSEREKVAELGRQFEAVLLREILSESQKTVFPSNLTTDSTTKGIYNDLIVEQMADRISRAGTLGLTRSFETQLTHQLASPPAPDGSSAPSPAAKPFKP